MEDPTSKIYTCFAFVSAASVVLSILYRKKQTRIVCSKDFWDQFWKYTFTKKIYHESINDLLSLNYDHNQLQFELNIATLTRFGMYSNIQNHIQIHKPSNIIKKYLPQIINKYFENHNLNPNPKQNMTKIRTFLSSNPLRILVPLCGCSYDLHYVSKYLQTEYGLTINEYKIIGIDLSSTAIIEFYRLNQMVFTHNSYNPKYMKQAHLYRVEIYSNIENNIHIVKDDIFKYYKLCKHLKEDIKINKSPCLIPNESIDIIIDINSLSCVNPSDRNLYIESMKYWLKDKGQMVLETYCYDPKLSNYPPYTVHPKDIRYYFGATSDKCELVETKQIYENQNIMTTNDTKNVIKNENDIELIYNCHSWIINK